MSYAFIQDVPANEGIYGQIRAKLGEVAPAGLVVHLVLKRETRPPLHRRVGLRGRLAALP